MSARLVRTAVLATGLLVITGCGSEKVAGSSPPGSTGAPSSTSSTGSTSSPTTPPVKTATCPARAQQSPTWVPQAATLAGTSDSLVPPGVPTSAVICSYPAGTNMDQQVAGKTFPLATSTTLAAGLDRIPNDLGYQMRARSSGRACTAAGGPVTNQLLGLTYRTGTVWVAAQDDPNNCSTTSNGTFTADPAFGRVLADSAKQARWVAPPRDGGCSRGTGRVGSDRDLIPGDPIGFTVCDESKAMRPPSAALRTEVIRVLGALPTTTAQGWSSCGQAPKPQQNRSLVFDYASGPAVSIDVFVGCTPELMGAGRQAKSAAPIVALLRENGYL